MELSRIGQKQKCGIASPECSFFKVHLLSKGRRSRSLDVLGRLGPEDPKAAPGSPEYEYGSQVANLENFPWWISQVGLLKETQ